MATDNETIEQVQSFILGFSASYCLKEVINIKLSKLQVTVAKYEQD
jgi:hypothetical protein